MTLEKNGNIIDIFGKVGEDPGSAWSDDVTAGYTDANGMLQLREALSEMIALDYR